MSLEETIKQTVKEAVQDALSGFNPQPAPDRPRTMTAKQAAAYIGISLPLMYELVHRADFDATLRVGSKILIVTDRLDAWIDRTRCAGKSKG